MQSGTTTKKAALKRPMSKREFLGSVFRRN
jgi:hypothetical protein